MPCHQINLITLKFTVKSKDRLIKSLKDLGYSVQETEGKVYACRMEFDLVRETVKSRYRWDFSNKVNEIRRKYSENTLKDLAKRKRWALRQREENKYVMTRY